MRKAIVNFWIDVVIAAAFTISAVTGILFLLPVSWRSISATGGAAILGMSVSALRHVHDWSGVVAAVGVVVHSALHLRWFVNMARRIARGEGRRAGPSPRPEAVPGPGAGSPPPSRAQMPAAPPHASLPVAAAVVVASTDDDRRVSRRSFLVGLGTAVGATAFLGMGALLRSEATSAAGTQLADTQNGATDPSQAQSGNGGPGAQGNGWQGGGSTQSGGGSSGSTGGVPRVVVDEAACVGCGRCLDVCPYGVFAWSGAKAVAQNPDACRLCGHCLQVCPANAITLNG